jgi:carboxylesterase
VMPWQPWGRPDISDPAAVRRHVGYKRFRTRAVYQLLALMEDTRARLPAVQSPLIVVHAYADHVVPPVNGHLIYDGVGSADKRLVWLDAGYHVATVDVAAPILNEEIARFVEARAGMAAATDAGKGA